MNVLLDRDEVGGHAFVYGELLIGNRGGRVTLLENCARMHQAPLGAVHARTSTQPPRYTRLVGGFYGHAASVLVIAVLAAGPAVASLCGAACVDPRPPVVTASTTDAVHHHAAADGESSSGRDRAVPTHQPGCANAAEASATAPDAIKASPARSCCAGPAQPRHSVTAARAGVNLVVFPHATVPHSVTPFDGFDPRPALRTHAPPPEGRPSARRPLILRI